jgi:hypothetical protein
MTIKELADELGLQYRERVDWANNLERSILMGHVKRNPLDVALMRSRHPAALAAWRALQAIERWRDRLPEELIAELERDPT